MKPHVAEADLIQREIIRKMTPAQKFAIARELYDTAWEIKKKRPPQATPRLDRRTSPRAGEENFHHRLRW
jgi:hypothetical protein